MSYGKQVSLISNILTQLPNPQFKARYNTKDAARISKQLDKSIITAAKKEGITKGVITAIVKKLMLSPRFEKLQLEEITNLINSKINEIIRQLKEEDNINLIAKKLNLNSYVKKSFFSSYKISQRNKEIFTMYQNKISLKEIAKKYNTTTENIRIILLKFGINLTEAKKFKHQKIIQLVNAGYTDEYIAMKLKISVDTVRQNRLKSGLKANSVKKELRDKIVTQLKKGIAPTELAKKYGYNINSIYKIGQTFNTYAYKIEQRDKQILELFNNGIPRKEIAKQLNLSYHTILRTIQRLIGTNA